MKIVTLALTCDGCGEPIQGNAGYQRNDYLELVVAQAPAPHSDVTFAMLQYPMLERTMHFHNLKCLNAWGATHSS